ncbi:hypothetical protein RJ639_040661 [Escallonia herrerae]|uniref:Cucumisin n=1 Tax=Escallonia herrerae TaxID=1293975 RepID=A0AA88WH24_9ASTE|nr:hypothetical protein RJ639_040661 [Escallonia herrerae]
MRHMYSNHNHAGRDGVVSVFPSRILKPQTTRSWDFTGLSANVRRNPTVESDVIVGVLDTRIWPESKSFSDEGFGPAPKKWKGACKGGTNFTCNNKLIGARYYADNNSARDTDGHGTHTASTATGIVVQNASFYGLARGTARGGVPLARIAAYKVLWSAWMQTYWQGNNGFKPGKSNVVNSFKLDGKEFPLVYAKDVSTKCCGGFSDLFCPMNFKLTYKATVSKPQLSVSVKNANFYGLLQGTARGGVPSARIAAYKVCHPIGCLENDILAAFDDAIADGVDIITISVGGNAAEELCSDSIAIGSFHAMERGILTVNSAGNNGFQAGSISSVAPWMLTGNAVNPFMLNGEKYPLAYGKDVTSSCDESNAWLCIEECLDKDLVKGKIVLCHNNHGMVTAWRMNATKNPEAEFAYGAGHIDPVKATNPGLVYDALKDDYIQMLCNLMYDNTKLRNLTGDISSCSEATKGSPKDLNHASMAAQVGETKPFRVEFPRTVTNVGVPNSAYRATISKPSQLTISVEPSILSFKSLNEKKSFIVTVSGQGFGSMASASLVWSDGNHSVRSPIVLYTHSAFVA